MSTLFPTGTNFSGFHDSLIRILNLANFNTYISENFSPIIIFAGTNISEKFKIAKMSTR